MDEEFKNNFTRIFKMKSLFALKFSYANVIRQYEKANKDDFTHFDDESINVILEFGRLIVCRENKSEEARKLSNNGEETMNVLFNRSVGNNFYNQRSPEIISFFPHGDNSESVINMISKELINSYGKINLELIECLENGDVLEFYGFLGEHNEVPVRLNLLSNEEKEKLLELVNIGDDKDLNINTPIAHLDIPDTKSIFPIDKKCEDYVKNNIPEFIKLHEPTRKISYPLTDIPKDIYAFFKSLSNIEIVDKISSLDKEVEYELMSEASNYFLRYLIKLSNPDFWEFSDEDDFWHELLKIKKKITDPLETELWLSYQIYADLKINLETESPYLYFLEWSIGDQDKFKNLKKFTSEVDFERICSLFLMAWKDAMSEERMKSLDEIKINFKNSLNYPFLCERETLVFDEVKDLPINKKAFTQAIEVTLWDRQLEDRIRGNKLSTATQNTIWYFKIESDPEICDFDGDDKKFFDYLLSLRESASSISKLKEYLDWRIEEDLEGIEDLEEDDEDDYREWEIGNKNSYEYQTIDEFINDVDFIEVVNQVSFAYRNSLSEKLMKRISELAKIKNQNLEKETTDNEEIELELEAVPDSEDQLDLAYELLEQRGKENEVIDLMNKYLQTKFNDLAYFYRGRAKQDLGIHSEAIDDFSKAITINDKKDLYFYVRGSSRSDSDDQEGAIEDYKLCIKLNPKNTNAYGNLAIAQKELGDYQDSIKSFDKAINIDPKHANNLRMRGNVKHEIKDYKGAIDDFNKALDIPSKIADQKAWREGIHAEIYFDRGWSKYELGDINSALKDWTKSSKLGNPKATKAIKLYANKDQIKNESSLIEVSEKFEAYWDLKEFKLLLEKGLELNSKYFFLIKHIGIYLYVRKTDYKPYYKVRREGGDCLIYAKGFDENKLSDEKIEIDSPEYKKEYEELRQKTDKLYQGDFCEWFNISNELLNEVEDKLNQGFINLKITIYKPLEICNEELEIDKSEENEEKFLMHGQTIKYGGGCPVSPFNTKLFLEYFSFSGQEKLSETYNGENLFINNLSANNILDKKREEEFSHYCDIVGKSEEKEDEGNLDEAIILLSQAIEKYPQFPIAYFKRGKIYRGLGEIKKAIFDYDKYISIFPEDFKGYVNRGIAKAQGKDFQGAIKDLEEGLKINPKDQIALFHLKEVKKNIKD